MKFRVIILRRADRDVRELLAFISARSPAGAASWARAFDQALVRLEQSADGLPLAVETEHVDFEVREVLFKTRRGLVYRALFTIHDHDVFILHVRGPGQDFMTADDLADWSE